MVNPMSDHVCQLFDTDESRTEHVAAFLAEGFHAGDYVIAVARPDHWTSIAARLEMLGIPVERRKTEGQLRVSDAKITLTQLCPRGRLNQFAFNEIIAAAIEPAAGRRVRAWGEMVDMLVERGDLDGALELEELWNGVSEMVPLTLICSYTAAHFVPAASHKGLRNLCLAHTDVRRSPDDSLANWVLTTAHHSGSQSSSLH